MKPKQRGMGLMNVIFSQSEGRACLKVQFAQYEIKSDSTFGSACDGIFAPTMFLF